MRIDLLAMRTRLRVRDGLDVAKLPVDEQRRLPVTLGGLLFVVGYEVDAVARPRRGGRDFEQDILRVRLSCVTPSALARWTWPLDRSARQTAHDTPARTRKAQRRSSPSTPPCRAPLDEIFLAVVVGTGDQIAAAPSEVSVAQSRGCGEPCFNTWLACEPCNAGIREWPNGTACLPACTHRYADRAVRTSATQQRRARTLGVPSFADHPPIAPAIRSVADIRQPVRPKPSATHPPPACARTKSAGGAGRTARWMDHASGAKCDTAAAYS